LLIEKQIDDVTYRVKKSAIKNLPRWQTSVVPRKEHTVMGSTIYEESVELHTSKQTY
jgi:hypothetical protein